MANNNNTKNLNVPNLRFPEFKGEWKLNILDSVCTFHNGRAYKQHELLSAGKYRVLRVGNFFTNDSWYYSDLELEEDKTASDGELLYAWSASFGCHTNVQMRKLILQSLFHLLHTLSGKDTLQLHPFH